MTPGYRAGLFLLSLLGSGELPKESPCPFPNLTVSRGSLATMEASLLESAAHFLLLWPTLPWVQQ